MIHSPWLKINDYLFSFFFIDVDECTLSPCMQNATCENTVGSFICHCDDGLGGLKCDEGESTWTQLMHEHLQWTKYLNPMQHFSFIFWIQWNWVDFIEAETFIHLPFYMLPCFQMLMNARVPLVRILVFVRTHSETTFVIVR